MPRPSPAQHLRLTLTDEQGLSRLEERNPIKWYNPMFKMRPQYRSRHLRVIVDKYGALELQELATHHWQRAISPELQTRFLEEAEGARRRWHSLDRGDVFANGATAIVYFKGESRTTLQLYNVPDIATWRALREDRVGAVERTTQGLKGPRRRISRLGGNQLHLVKEL